MGRARPATRRTPRLVTVLLAALAALGVGALTGCGSPAENDPLVGYWAGGGSKAR